MPSPPCQGLPKHPRRWLQRWLGDTHQSANHNAGELWSQRWQKMRENQQCFGPKRLLWPVQHYLYSLFDLKQRIFKKTRDWQESTWVSNFLCEQTCLPRSQGCCLGLAWGSRTSWQPPYFWSGNFRCQPLHGGYYKWYRQPDLIFVIFPHKCTFGLNFSPHESA